MLLISQFVTNQICSHVTDLLSFVSLAFLCNPADFLPDYLFHLQCYIWAECFKCFYDTDDVHLWQPRIVLFKASPCSRSSPTGTIFLCQSPSWEYTDTFHMHVFLQVDGKCFHGRSPQTHFCLLWTLHSSSTKTCNSG